MSAGDLSVYGDWLVQEANGCTCCGLSPHEPGCGYEPLVKIEEIKAALTEARYAVVAPHETVTDLSNHSVNGVRQTWQQLYEREHAAKVELEDYRLMLGDLDRNEHGRHEGDVDGGDPTGASQGNPHLKTGDVLGYSIGGYRRKYVVPEPRLRGDIKAWQVEG